MELGLHHSGTLQHMGKDDKRHSTVINLLWSIVILDRQWSCAAGLPQNFQDADFAKSLPAPCQVRDTSDWPFKSYSELIPSQGNLSGSDGVIWLFRSQHIRA